MKTSRLSQTIIFALIILLIGSLFPSCNDTPSEPQRTNPLDVYNPDIEPQIESVFASSTNGLHPVEIRVEASCCKEFQLSSGIDRSFKPSGDWVMVENLIEYSIDGNDGDIYYIGIRGRSYNGRISEVAYSNEIKIDKSCSIALFAWSSSGGDILQIGDRVTFTLVIEEDAFGAETGGEAVVTVEGWDPIELDDQGDGSYNQTITITSDYPCVRNAAVTAIFTDRVGNNSAPATASKSISTFGTVVFNLGNSGETIEMVWIPAGTFWMGAQSDESDAQSDEMPRHQVTISQGFWMGKYEVTQAQWEAVAGDEDFYFDGYPDRPAERVSHDDIMDDFLPEINATEMGSPWRLPTEAEWEYACRAGVDDEWFCWGSNYTNFGDYAWYYDNSSSRTHNVGNKRPNPWGLFDMHGNVSEWCQDWYGNYLSDSVTDPTGPLTGSRRVIRGGSYVNYFGYCRSANRLCFYSFTHRGYVGFRLLRSGG